MNIIQKELSMYEVGKYYRDALSKDVMQLTTVTLGVRLDDNGKAHHFVDLVFRLLRNKWVYDCKRIREVYIPFTSAEEKATVNAFLQRLLSEQPPAEALQEVSETQSSRVPAEHDSECTASPESQIPTEDPDTLSGDLFRSSEKEPNEPEEQEGPSQ